MSDPIAEPASPNGMGDPARSSVRRCFRFSSRIVGALIWFGVVTGLVLRFTVRDRYHPWALIYYLTPIPALPIWLLLAALLRGRDRYPRRVYRGISLKHVNWMLISGLTAWAFFLECVSRARSDQPGDMQFLFWNTARAQMGLERIGAKLRDGNFLVIGLVEADENHLLNIKEWQNELPDYQMAGTHFGGLVAVRGEILAQKWHLLKPTSWCEEFELRVGGHEFTLLLVDISSQLSRSRAQPLRDLAMLGESLENRPVIIMGDFNTPDDSVWFEPLKKRFRQVFRECGHGYAATWPIPLPVLTLDQVWVNDLVVPSNCEHGWTINSDHRPVISSVSFR